MKRELKYRLSKMSNDEVKEYISKIEDEKELQEVKEFIENLEKLRRISLLVKGIINDLECEVYDLKGRVDNLFE